MDQHFQMIQELSVDKVGDSLIAFVGKKPSDGISTVFDMKSKDHQLQEFLSLCQIARGGTTCNLQSSEASQKIKKGGANPQSFHDISEPPHCPNTMGGEQSFSVGDCSDECVQPNNASYIGLQGLSLTWGNGSVHSDVTVDFGNDVALSSRKVLVSGRSCKPDHIHRDDRGHISTSSSLMELLLACSSEEGNDGGKQENGMKSKPHYLSDSICFDDSEVEIDYAANTIAPDESGGTDCKYRFNHSINPGFISSCNSLCEMYKSVNPETSHVNRRGRRKDGTTPMRSDPRVNFRRAPAGMNASLNRSLSLFDVFGELNRSDEVPDKELHISEQDGEKMVLEKSIHDSERCIVRSSNSNANVLPMSMSISECFTADSLETSHSFIPSILVQKKQELPLVDVLGSAMHEDVPGA